MRAHHKPVKASKNAWRCVKVAVDPEARRSKPTVSEPKISCAGGTPKNGTCTCARTHKLVRAGKNAWRCVKVVVIDTPRNKDSANTSGAKIKGEAKVKSNSKSSAKKSKPKGTSQSSRSVSR